MQRLNFSFQALLSTYLLENVDMLSKHCLVIYLLLDLVSVDNTDSAEQVVSQFEHHYIGGAGWGWGRLMGGHISSTIARF